MMHTADGIRQPRHTAEAAPGAATAPPTCHCCWLGTVEYQRARAIQDAVAEDVRNGQTPNTLLLLEHPHVYTRGRLSREEHLLSPAGQLAAAGIPVYETDRGGQITYHGPGQLVGYPIINLRQWGGGPLQYIRALERAIVSVVTAYGIPAHTEPGLTGVWTPGGKIAAIGVKVSGGVTRHGFALNVNTDLGYYRHIVPCGIADRPVTSLAAELGAAADPAAVRRALAREFGAAMGWGMVECNDGEFIEMAI